MSTRICGKKKVRENKKEQSNRVACVAAVHVHFSLSKSIIRAQFKKFKLKCTPPVSKLLLTPLHSLLRTQPHVYVYIPMYSHSAC